MTRRYDLRRGLAALLIALLALALAGTARIGARAEGEDALLRAQVSVRPEGLIEPGDVILSFTIENVSDVEAQNVYLSSADGLIFEPVGQIAPGEMRTFSRQHSVTERELEDGEIDYTISYDDPAGGGAKANYGVRAQIRRSDAHPNVEFTRQFSSRSVEAGGTLTVTYRVRNSGNVPLTELLVQDSLGNYTGRVETLEVGESRTLINRVGVAEPVTSSARLRYRANGGDELMEEALTDVTVRVASAGMTSEFSADYSAFSRSSANVVLTLTNTGDVGYRDLCVIDDLYGGVIADELVLPAGGEPVEVSRGYNLRGEQGFRWRVTGRSDSGAEVDFTTDTVALPVEELDAEAAMRVTVNAATPRIRRAGDVTMRARIENIGGVELRDLTLAGDGQGDLLNFAVLPVDGAIQRDFTLHVSDDATFGFSVRATDAQGAAVTATASPVQVVIAADGALPAGAQQLIEFSGGSIKIGGSSTFAVLLLAGFAVLLVLIVMLIIANRRARIQREQRAAESRRRREEMGKTARITPLRAPQKTKGKGRNG